VAHRAVPLEEKVALIVSTLARVAGIEFSRLVKPFADKLHGVVTFVAGLELAKRHQVELRQSEPFAPLWFYRRKEEITDETDADR
jgi:chromatin segregation and condensation protein Rec8/ScpA/Scc1 (kleisin family)